MNVTYEDTYHLVKILMVSCYCTSFIVGIIGNGLVIWISGYRMKTVSTIWFLNLAIADLIFCLSLPVRVIDWLLISQYFIDILSITVFLNIFNFLMLAINAIVSVTFLTVISVHRCVSILWPLWAKIHWTRRSARIASFFFWIGPLAFLVFMESLISPPNGFAVSRTFYLTATPPECLLRNNSFYDLNNDSQLLSTINSVFTFGIPFFIILICNGLIAFKLHSNKFRRPKAFHRTFRLIVAVVVCFFVCWFPFNIWPIIAIKINMRQMLADFLVSNVCLCLVSISSCMNPVIYVLMGHTRGPITRKSIKARMRNAMNDFI